MRQLNAALPSLADDLRQDSLAAKRVEIAIVSFPPVQTQIDFCGPADFRPPQLTAGGVTPMGAAVHHALALIENRKAFYQQAHIDWFRPWMFLVTDGAPDLGDDWRGAAAAVREGEAKDRLSFFAVGVPGADMGILREFSTRPPLTLDRLRFRDMFVWLSRSLQATSRSTSHTGANPVEKVKLMPVDWGEA